MSASSRGDHHHLGAVTEEHADDSNESDSETTSTVPQNKRDDLVNPYWIEDPDVGKGEVEFLSSTESQFWKDLLDKYLYPIDEDKDEKVKRGVPYLVTSTLSNIKLLLPTKSTNIKNYRHV